MTMDIQPSSTGKGTPFEISLGGLYLRNLGTHFLCFAVIVTLNFFTPLDFFKTRKVIMFSEGGWIAFFLFYPFAMALVALMQHRIQLPISRLSVLRFLDMNVSGDMLERARTRTINLPVILALMNLATYIIMPIFITSALYLFIDIHLKTCLFLIFRAIMIGLITMGISFFLVEDFLRKALIPALFPDGRLAVRPGTVKIPILRRIRLLNLAGTLNPMLLMLITFLFILWELNESGLSAVQLGKELFVFTLVLCILFIIIALNLNVLVSHSILNPIKEILGVIEKVKGGDFSQKIKIVSNDEIGVLGDAGNDMIKGLADREKIRDTFGKYVTPEIRDRVLRGEIPLNGERRTATLLFSDLRDFTPYVEANPPEEVFRSMREYFTAMEKAIRIHRGLVLQFVGDEIEAVFGVPIAFDRHADEAVSAAVDMWRNLETLNRRREKEGKTPFRHGIGIHTGEVLAGNTGSEERLSYTLIGDAVNLASRIQDLTKECESDILLSENTAGQLRTGTAFRESFTKSVKGYSKPVKVFGIDAQEESGLTFSFD